jgi:hypothetical protein
MTNADSIDPANGDEQKVHAPAEHPVRIPIDISDKRAGDTSGQGLSSGSIANPAEGQLVDAHDVVLVDGFPVQVDRGIGFRGIIRVRNDAKLRHPNHSAATGSNHRSSSAGFSPPTERHSSGPVTGPTLRT